MRDDDAPAEQGLPVFLAGGDDLAVRLRELAFGVLLQDAEPVEVERLASLSGMDGGVVREALDALALAGKVDRDESGRVLGSAGLTISSGAHDLTLAGHRYRTWCAFDAIGIAAALGWDARIDTACGICGRMIRLEMTSGFAPAGAAARLWLSGGGRDMRADFCTPTVLLCSEEHARAWANRHGQHGQTLELEPAAAVGARTWRSAADVAHALRHEPAQQPATWFEGKDTEGKRR